MLFLNLLTLLMKKVMTFIFHSPPSFGTLMTKVIGSSSDGSILRRRRFNWNETFHHAIGRCWIAFVVSMFLPETKVGFFSEVTLLLKRKIRTAVVTLLVRRFAISVLGSTAINMTVCLSRCLVSFTTPLIPCAYRFLCWISCNRRDVKPQHFCDEWAEKTLFMTFLFYRVPPVMCSTCPWRRCPCLYRSSLKKNLVDLLFCKTYIVLVLIFPPCFYMILNLRQRFHLTNPLWWGRDLTLPNPLKYLSLCPNLKQLWSCRSDDDCNTIVISVQVFIIFFFFKSIKTLWAFYEAGRLKVRVMGRMIWGWYDTYSLFDKCCRILESKSNWIVFLTER